MDSSSIEVEAAMKNWEVSKERLTSMQQKIWNAPKLLTKSAGRSSCSIFRVPQSLVDINGRSYQPHVISIGPYHHGQRDLEMMEEHKWRFLGSLINRTQIKGLSLEDYLKVIQPLEQLARECYSETIGFTKDEFVEMLVLDGCFVIELFRKFGNVVDFEEDDPLVSMSWVYPFFLRDLIRLENQIPFFILQCLFDLTLMPQDKSLVSLPTLALNFFNNALQRDKALLAKYKDLQPKHLLDLVRTSFIPDNEGPSNVKIKYTSSQLIQCISKLRRAGIKLRPGNGDSFLVVEFSHGVIQMPTITLDDFMSSFLINCVAYEQCHKCSKYVTTYATLLDCLINTFKDVEYLCDKNIIENYFGTDSEVARLINNLGKDVSFDANECYLSGLFNEVNGYYINSWHVQWASFKYTYFRTTWSFISAMAAFILLILTILQTIFTIIN